MSDAIERIFPLLTTGNYRVTSPSSPRYNCFAWAAQNEAAWWEPDPMDQGFWPAGVPRQKTVQAFIEAFRTLDYSSCETGEVEPGYEKIVIYIDDAGTPTHAARQTPDGKWTSKLGRLEDIEHDTLDTLAGSLYGSVGLFLRRNIR